MKVYNVASGLLIDGQRILLVQNQRRNGSTDWSPPGGVVDAGETVLEALRREVSEETCLQVDDWSEVIYTVDVEFAARKVALRARVFRALTFGGSLLIDDPDAVVVDGNWFNLTAALARLERSPRWISEPLLYALDGRAGQGLGLEELGSMDNPHDRSDHRAGQASTLAGAISKGSAMAPGARTDPVLAGCDGERPQAPPGDHWSYRVESNGSKLVVHKIRGPDLPPSGATGRP